MFKVLFLNLPNPQKIVRRYMCSYNSPTFLYPPTELICLAAVAKEWYNLDVKLVDAVAESFSSEQVKKIVEDDKPEVIVCLTGFECFEEDANELKYLKQSFPETRIIAFGHYATHFSKELLEYTGVDYVLLGEPDLVFADLLKTFVSDASVDEINGISYLKNGNWIKQGDGSRVPDPNELPVPAYHLLNPALYGEPFLPAPFGLIQTARGCPYKCNYCVKSFGTKLTALSPEKITEHIQYLISEFGIRSLRFIDDTFTATPARVIRLCKLMIEKKIELQWTCLSRADTLNREMLEWMKKAGCVRLFVGMETGSQKMLDVFSKGVKVEQALENLLYAKSLGFELMGFFLVGHPDETEDDFLESIRFAQRVRFDYITVSGLQVYPGTSLFDQLKTQVDFSLIPYRNVFKDRETEERKYRRAEQFYKLYYFTPQYIARTGLPLLAKRPMDFVKNGVKLSKHLLFGSSNKKRADYL